ncbi:hypothetical protein RRG08_046965 [Elysia crispata]|uniref:Uncharacterized protein n=1 Tax=Elysia crispata TaxID=231223 RepID=A0AAE1A9K9_9GAST|nr:hypothetical protein RRG08_046965 [Elysia crispata]
MDMFTLLKNSMGADDVNPILKHFSLGKQTGSAGVEMTWKIYEAVRLEDKKVAGQIMDLVQPQAEIVRFYENLTD